MADDTEDNNGENKKPQLPRINWGGGDDGQDNTGGGEPKREDEDEPEQGGAAENTDNAEETTFGEDDLEDEPELVVNLNPKRGETKRVTRESRQADKDAGLFRLTLIGFPAAGKTQFLNALKQVLDTKPWYGGPFSGRLGSKISQDLFDALGLRGRYRINPGIAREGGQTAGIWAHHFRWGPKADKTFDASAEETTGADDAAAADEANGEPKAAPQHRDHPRSFVIYDASGETLEKGVTVGGNQTAPGELYEVLADSDALIVLLPSNYLLAPEDDVGRLAAQIQTHLAAELKSHLGAVPDGNDQEGMNPLERYDRQTASAQHSEKIETLKRFHAILGLIWGDTSDNDLVQDPDLQDIAKDARKDLEGQFQKLVSFRTDLNQLLDVAAVMRHGSLTYADYITKTETELEALRQKAGTAAPLAYFAMSKSDTVIMADAPIVPLKEKLITLVTDLERKDGREIPDGEKLSEEQVRDLLDKYAPEVFSAANHGVLDKISDLFAGTKVDFLTTYQPKIPKLLFDDGSGAYDENTGPYHEHEAHGVDAVIQWVQYARARRTHGGGRVGRLWRGFWRSKPIEALERLIAKTGVTGSFVTGLVVAPLTLAIAAWFLSNYWSGRTAAAAADQSISTPIKTEARYPSEVTFLKSQDPLMRSGRPSEVLRPWYEIPTTPRGDYFVTSTDDRDRRALYESILATTSSWNPRGTVNQQAINKVKGEVQRLQDLEDASASQSDDGNLRRRSFSHWHMGLAEFRTGLNARVAPDSDTGDADGAFARAATEFAGLIAVMDSDPSSTTIGRKRELGMRIAAWHAKGLAELLDPDTPAATARASLYEAVNLIPKPGDARRNDVWTGTSFFIDRSNSTLSPAQYSSLDIYADLIAAHVAGFSAEQDLNPDGEFASLISELAPLVSQVPNDHRLRTNLAIAGSLLGLPREDIPPPTTSTSVRDEEVIEIALDAASEEGVWKDIGDLRESFEDGDANEVATIVDSINNATGLTTREKELARDTARDILLAERDKLRPAGRSELLAPYIGKVAGFSSDELARDIAGGDTAYTIKSWLPWIAAGILAFLFFWLSMRAAETAFVQTSPQHRNDRKAKEKAGPREADEDDPAEAAEA